MVGLAIANRKNNGAYQAGAYMAFKKCKIKIDAVVGSGIGAFNGALIASCDDAIMCDLWNDISLNPLLTLDQDRAREVLKKFSALSTTTWNFSELYKMFKNSGLDVSNFRALVRNQIDEKKLRESNIKYGLVSLNPSTLESILLYLEDIPQGKLYDYIVTSSYFSEPDNFKTLSMLNKIGCTTIYNVDNNRSKVNSQKNIAAKIIDIVPKNNNLDGKTSYNENDIQYTMWNGYYDALKVLNKIDGVDYYFEKKPNWYYKRLNHKVDKELFNTVSIILNSNNYREIVLKALEYTLKSEESNYLKVYKQDDIIKSVKGKETDNIIYRYIKKLSIW